MRGERDLLLLARKLDAEVLLLEDGELFAQHLVLELALLEVLRQLLVEAGESLRLLRPEAQVDAELRQVSRELPVEVLVLEQQRVVGALLLLELVLRALALALELLLGLAQEAQLLLVDVDQTVLRGFQVGLKLIGTMCFSFI